MPTATTTPMFLGAYTANYFLNPITAFTDGTNTVSGSTLSSDSFTRNDPSTSPTQPGSIGYVRWIPAKTGAFADSLYYMIDSTFVLD